MTDAKARLLQMIADEPHMAEGGTSRVTPLSKRFNLGEAGTFDPIGNAKKTLSGAYDVASKIPANLKALVTNPVAYARSLPEPTGEQMMNAFMPGNIGMAGVIKPVGGNWLGGRVEKELGRLKSLGANGADPVATLAELEKKYGKKGMEEVLAAGLHPMLKENAALNRWIDSNLGNYVKKQMATPDDPVRKLAEQGITHKLSLPNEYQDALAPTEQRVSAGFPAEGVGQSPLARSWENASDEAVAAYNAGEIQNAPQKAERIKAAKQKVTQELEALNQKFESHIRNSGLKENEIQGLMRTMTPAEKSYMIGDNSFSKANADYLAQGSPVTESQAKMMEENPWIAKVDPNSSVYSPHIGDLGFDHIVDVLNEDLANGRIRPEQMNKISMEQAVRRAHEYDQEMAKRMAAAQAKVTEGMPVHKEYPEGYKWIELAPSKMPEGWTVPERYSIVSPDLHPETLAIKDNETGRFISTGFTSEADATKHLYNTLNKDGLATALKYEGDTMGHCVGGYCPDVEAGRSRIFSLRDAKGEPHVTIETRPNQARSKYETDWFSKQPEDVQDKITSQALAEHELSKSNRTPEEDRFTWGQALSNAIKSHMGEVPEQIIQIKGKQNRAPKEEYLPYVQDFVKSGNWSDVGDLQNAKLYPAKDIHNFMPENFTMSKNARTLAIGRARAAGDVPDYMTKPEYEAMLLKHAPEDIWAAEKKKYADEADDLLRQLQPPEEGMAEGGEAKSFFEEKSAKQRIMEIIAKEPHMDNGVMAVQLPLQLQGDVYHDEQGGIGLGGRATYTHPVGKDAAIRAYIEGGGYKPKDMDYKGQVNNMGISYEKEFKDGGDVQPLSKRFDLGKAGKFDPVGNAKKTLGRALDVASQIPGNLQALVSDPAAYVRALPQPSEEQMLGAFMPGDMGMAGVIKPKVEHPLVFPRAAAKTIEDIRPIAQRMAEQVTGDFVKQNPKVTTNPAGKSRKQFERERSIPLETRNLVPEREAPNVNYEDYMGHAIVGVPGDPTMGGVAKRGSLEEAAKPTVELNRVGDITPDHPVPLFGGPRYGDENKFWASNLSAAVPVQNSASELAKLYESPVLGKYIKMGEGSENFALHNLDALLSIQQPEKLSKAKMAELTKRIQAGSPEYGKFPGFTGFKDPADVLLQAQMDSKLRKHIAETLTKPTITNALGLPNGLDVVAAITYPELRNLETGASGFSVGKLQPGAELVRGQSSHPTYDTDIPGSFLGRNKYPTPYEIAFPDTTAYARSQLKPGVNEFSMMKMLGPRERIDQQYIDEMKMYEDLMKQYTGKKKGGLAHTKKVKRYGNTVSN
jgi:hypothetical protein